VSRSLKEWLARYEEGVDEEDHTCRGCRLRMWAEDYLHDPSVFCNSCAQYFLPMLVEGLYALRAGVLTALGESEDA
jgi:hypothetical protein